MKKVAIICGLLFLMAITFGSLWAAEVTHTPCVGAVTSNSARIVVRTDEAAAVQISYNSTLTDAVTTVSEYDFFVIIDLTGLQPNTTYAYFPVVDGVDQTGFAGFFKTFPEDGVTSTFSFLFGSGQQQVWDDPNSNIGDLFPIMVQQDGDALFFIHQGDWHYPDTTDSEKGDTTNYFALHYDLVQASYKTRYDPNYPMSELLKVMSVDYVYDDHDWVNDNCDKTYMDLGGSNSILGYQEMFPHYPLENASKGVWHKVTCGNADLFMIDNRAQRDPDLNALMWIDAMNRYIFTANYLDNHTILGDEQMDWLINELKNSTADWKFISSPVMFNPAHRGIHELALMLQNSSYDPIINPATGEPVTLKYLSEEFSDRWAGFPSDIYKLISAIIDNQIENVIMLSGDSHDSGLDDGTNSLIPELLAGGLDRTNSQINALAKEVFHANIWNKGGHTYDNAIPPDLGNAYGKVSVFGADSVKLEVVSETTNILASHTVTPGVIPRRVAGVIAPGGMDFGLVPPDATGGQAVNAICTSVDNFVISNILVTIVKGQSQIVPVETTADLAPGEAKMLEFGFIPVGNLGDTTQALITILCNDGGFKFIQAQGIIGYPIAVDDEDNSTMALDYKLNQNYPNPFNPSTTISFSVPQSSQVDLIIYNTMGQQVKQLTSRVYPTGNHNIVWDGRDNLNQLVGSGVYFVLFKTEKFKQSAKIIMMK